MSILGISVNRLPEARHRPSAAFLVAAVALGVLLAFVLAAWLAWAGADVGQPGDLFGPFRWGPHATRGEA